MIKTIAIILLSGLGLYLLSSCTKNDDNSSYEKNLKEGQEYMAANGQREGVITTASGLQYEVLEEGNPEGKSPKASDTVVCRYEGTFIDGTVFDSTYRTGTTCSFPLNGVIAGWTEGLQYMKEGAKYRFVIPYQLAYGPSGYASIPPYSTLVFVVELVQVL